MLAEGAGGFRGFGRRVLGRTPVGVGDWGFRGLSRRVQDRILAGGQGRTADREDCMMGMMKMAGRDCGDDGGCGRG